MGKLSAGGAAGIGIGCTIAGMLICALVFGLLSRRKWRHVGSVGSNEHMEEFVPGAGEKTRSVRIDGGRAVSNPPRSRSSSSSTCTTTTIGTIEAADQEFREEHYSLMVSIKGHAELYHTTKPITEADSIRFCDANLETLNELLGPNALLDAFAMDSLLRASETRHDAIRLLVAWVIFRYIQPDAPIEHTLLPPELVKCAQAMSHAAATVQTAEDENPKSSYSIARKPLPLTSNPISSGRTASSSSHVSPRSPTQESTERLTFAKWRATSGTLFAPIFGPHGKVTSPSDPRTPNINNLVTTLVCLLQPYVARGYGGARVRDLENVVKQGAAFGYRLFVQRTEWEFAWSTLMGDEVVVYPALVSRRPEIGASVLMFEDRLRLGMRRAGG